MGLTGFDRQRMLIYGQKTLDAKDAFTFEEVFGSQPSLAEALFSKAVVTA